LQNFSNLRATRTVTPGRILSVTEGEIAEITAKAAALTKEAAARTEIARAGIEEARRKQEEAISRYEALLPEFQASIRDSGRKTDAIIAELKEHRDERRALLEAIFRVLDRLD
jgi:DNA anti-recombination protein RmuC